MKLSKLSTALLAGSLLTMGMTAKAEEASGPFTTSGDVTMTTDYFYRGVTQSDGPALQGTLSISHESGMYFTLWGSSINFANNLELDPSIGFSGTSGDIGYDVGVLYYGYPNSTAPDGGTKADFVEFYGSVSYAGASLGLAYAPDFTYESGKNYYVNASYGTEIAGIGLSAAVGYNFGDGTETLFGDKYMDYKVAVSKSFLDVTAELAVIGNDLEESVVGPITAQSSAVVFSLSKSL